MTTEKIRTAQLKDIVAVNVRKLRTEQRMSQEFFADKCGYHRTYIGAVERAERNITLSTLEAFATALGVNPIELLKPNE
jgi:transcriptional regulator with XRE-family HTH domain